MILKQLDVDAHATIIAMPKVLSATHPTKAARGTMIRGFIIGHPQITNAAVIFAKLNTARNTVLAAFFFVFKIDVSKHFCTVQWQYASIHGYVRFTALTSIALSTYDFFYGKTVDEMVCFWFFFLSDGHTPSAIDSSCYPTTVSSPRR